jgi:ABC-2 type transport system ATP-binding protein
MIEVEKLTKLYGDFVAVRELSFGVAKGEVVGFLGPNGAGKSTTLRILAGFLGATSGDVRIAGHSIVDESLLAREKIGYMPETAPLYTEMRVSEYLAFRAELKGVPSRDRKAAIARAMSDAGLADRERTVIGQLSKGYRQRVGLADALVASPPLLLLDEPTAGLDPNQIREFRALIRRLAEEHTIVVSTHILSEVEATCTRGIVIARGALVAEGSIDELRALRRSRGVRVRVRGDTKAALPVLRAIAGVAEVEREKGEGSLVVTFAEADGGDRVTEEVVAALVGNKLGVLEVSPVVPSLEQVFSDLTQAPDPAERAERAAEADA